MQIPEHTVVCNCLCLQNTRYKTVFSIISLGTEKRNTCDQTRGVFLQNAARKRINRVHKKQGTVILHSIVHLIWLIHLLINWLAIWLHLVGRPVGNHPLRTQRKIWEESIQVDVRETGLFCYCCSWVSTKQKSLSLYLKRKTVKLSVRPTVPARYRLRILTCEDKVIFWMPNVC
jgi:hypothetical protein